ncbi:MAG: CBS domain-containing protein [Pseudomonadota bacterium]
MMQREHVRRKLVIDSNERLRGVVSLADLMSSKVIKAIEATGLKPEDLTVASVMVHKDTLQAVELKEFDHARIGDVLRTMKQFGEEHLLVVDGATNRLCGIVSTTDIARKLHQAVTIDERATTFSDIYKSIRA